jgi:hypothetical protein
MTKPKKEEIIVERHLLDPLVIYEVSGEQLVQMEQETLSVSEDFSFCLAGLSIAVTIAATIFSVPIASERVYNSFLIVMIFGILVTLYCGTKWLRGRKTFKGVVQRIKSRVGPLGEQGKELDETSLAALPQLQPPSLQITHQRPPQRHQKGKRR